MSLCIASSDGGVRTPFSTAIFSFLRRAGISSGLAKSGRGRGSRGIRSRHGPVLNEDKCLLVHARRLSSASCKLIPFLSLFSFGAWPKYQLSRPIPGFVRFDSEPGNRIQCILSSIISLLPALLAVPFAGLPNLTGYLELLNGSQSFHSHCLPRDLSYVVRNGHCPRSTPQHSAFEVV